MFWRYLFVRNSMSTDARDQFDRTAASYAVSRAHSASESLGLLREFAGDRRYGRAIDIATGPGFTTFAVADLCDDVIATDISRGMLDQVEKLACERELENAGGRLSTRTRFRSRTHHLTWSCAVPRPAISRRFQHFLPNRVAY
jgi:protein-L-isoaspartate O-methyltransferase